MHAVAATHLPVNKYKVVLHSVQAAALVHFEHPELHAVHTLFVPLKVAFGQLVPQIFPLLSLNFDGIATKNKI